MVCSRYFSLIARQLTWVTLSSNEELQDALELHMDWSFDRNR